jgi:large subunit ribosomal protein L13
MGKNKVVFAPNAEVGDKVVVTNVKEIEVTGRKLQNKVYQHYTGFPGGLRTETLGKLMDRKPTEALRLAVSGMLPKNKLRKIWMSNLYLYEGAEHPHKAQETKR